MIIYLFIYFLKKDQYRSRDGYSVYEPKTWIGRVLQLAINTYMICTYFLFFDIAYIVRVLNIFSVTLVTCIRMILVMYLVIVCVALSEGSSCTWKVH